MLSKENGSIFWKFLFYVLKYIQTAVLVGIFLSGSDNLNTFKNLGFMVFFVIFTASEQLYRQWSRILILFTSFFIFGQYAYFLTYKSWENSSQTIKTRLEWLHFTDPANPPTWDEKSSIYFRYKPDPMDWTLLLMMSSLNLINMLFVNEAEANGFSIICYEGIRDRYSKVMFRLVRFKNFVSSFFIFIVLAVLIYFIGKAQTNMISTAFFLLNIINLALIAKADNKQ